MRQIYQKYTKNHVCQTSNCLWSNNASLSVCLMIKTRLFISSSPARSLVLLYLQIISTFRQKSWDNWNTILDFSIFSVYSCRAWQWLSTDNWTETDTSVSKLVHSLIVFCQKLILFGLDCVKFGKKLT